MTGALSDPGPLAEAFFQRGWVPLPHDPDIAAWVAAVRPVAEALAADPVQQDRWLRCGGTWFAGVNILPNDPDGSLPQHGVPPLGGAPVRFIRDVLGLDGFAWDAAQISVCYPGYPQPWSGETEAAFRFRRDRDAAHLDGLLRDERRRRSPGETHGFILGLPLADAHPDAAPLVVWEGSHTILRDALRERLAGTAPADWSGEDVTEVYTAARRRCFEACPRVAVHARPGAAFLVHRLALHGVAPWPDGVPGTARPVAYFRPDPYPGQPPEWWLARP